MQADNDCFGKQKLESDLNDKTAEIKQLQNEVASLNSKVKALELELRDFSIAKKQMHRLQKSWESVALEKHRLAEINLLQNQKFDAALDLLNHYSIELDKTGKLLTKNYK